ncbi:MAG: hypothetical protein PHS75_03935 [Anaerolineaceae bacterium]|jgi:hypothetical protein|nr:hypothetical protein [Anaerolineaceae bacterium]MDD4577688.1 hypothetical protein [Anaerolineaceae bacterium]
MDNLYEDYSAGILDNCEPPCLSLYMPTHRQHPDNQQDPILFRNLVKELEESLLKQYSRREVDQLLEPATALMDDREFWNHSLDGLALLIAKDFSRIYRLQLPTPKIAVVANSFHLKPLMYTLQSIDRYQVLGLNQEEVKLFEGNRNALDEIELHPDVPRTLKEALGSELTEPYLNFRSPGGVRGSQTVAFHGHGSKDEEMAVDAERFFRAVDKAILEHHSKPSGLPLILAAQSEHHHMFREVSNNPFLVEESLDVHPDSLASIDELRERAWKLMEPRYLARKDTLVEQYAIANSQDLAGDHLKQVAQAVAVGRVATLLIEANRQVPGRIDEATGAIEYGEMDHPEVDDVIDDLAALALKMGGEVAILPADQMPTETGIAAIYRY